MVVEEQKSIAAEKVFDRHTFTLEEVLKAQPLNPFRQIKVTAMPLFPVNPPAAEGGSGVFHPAKNCVIISTEKSREDWVREYVEVYAKLDEVIE